MLLGRPGLHAHREQYIASAGPCYAIMRVACSAGRAGIQIPHPLPGLCMCHRS